MTARPDLATGTKPRATPTNRRSRAPGGARWAWRTLTSMRTALLLLCLVALAAIPGSLLPQGAVNPGEVTMFARAHPRAFPLLDRLWLFDVFASPWFAAVYLLLLMSLTGCVLPRAQRLLRSLRSVPARPPRDLSRQAGVVRFLLPDGRSDSGAARDELLDVAAAELRRRRFRVRRDVEFVAAEKGRLHEAANLMFHLSLLLMLAAVAVGHLYGYRGRVVVAEGSTFANTQTQYDEFLPGPWVDPDQLTPLSLRLQAFTARYQGNGPQRGAPRQFTASVSYRPAPAASPRRRTLTVNHPLVVDGTKMFLTGHGYAPRFTVRDGSGRLVFSGPVPFLPRDGMLTSFGAVKAPDARPTQLAFDGFFLPTAALGPNGPFSAFPGALNPQVLLTAYTGNVGLDSGVPQSVYRLDKSGLRQVRANGKPFARALRPGDTMTLPGGQGSITFDGVADFANFQIAHDPGRALALAAAVLMLAGLLVSLSMRPQRVAVRIGGSTDASESAAAQQVLVARWGAARPQDHASSVVVPVADAMRRHLDTAAHEAALEDGDKPPEEVPRTEAEPWTATGGVTADVGSAASVIASTTGSETRTRTSRQDPRATSEDTR